MFGSKIMVDSSCMSYSTNLKPSSWNVIVFFKCCSIIACFEQSLWQQISAWKDLKPNDPARPMLALVTCDVACLNVLGLFQFQYHYSRIRVLWDLEIWKTIWRQFSLKEVSFSPIAIIYPHIIPLHSLSFAQSNKTSRDLTINVELWTSCPNILWMWTF